MSKASWRRLTLAPPFVPVAGGLAATGLDLAQGGFGAGHGDDDPMIGILGFPAILLLASGLPVPRFLGESDPLVVIWYPALLNALFFWTPLACFLFRAGGLGRSK